MADQKLGKTDEARRWLNQAQTWLDQRGDGMPARAEQELGIHLHNYSSKRKSCVGRPKKR